MELAGDEMDEDTGTEDWINKIDRGGLWHVNDDVHSLFLEMEYEAKRFLGFPILLGACGIYC